MTLTKNARRIAAGALAAAALPVALATSAQAHTTSGCTVEPLTPTYAYTQSNGVKVLNYRISVNCQSGRTAYITQERYEEDGFLNPDDHVGTSYFSARGVQTLNNYRTLVDTESGQEEMYQKIRFYVRSDNGVVSAWTGWHTSAVRSFYN
ncbi:MAG: hypothetical protein QM619_10025 [Micropruina sp.]|uniref:hypothetical protein n=1 Tax=Micropruina sp. TaxID=2737536 RepID=UPI0039E46400